MSFLVTTGIVAQDTYKYFVNLNAVKNDELGISLSCPEVEEDTVEFHFPKIVPGTYAIYDFGRFISEFTPKDSAGNRLLYKKLDDNRYEIYGAKSLNQITYKLEDTYDTKKGNKIFEPAGTNIQDGENFVVNTFGFFGYIDGYKDRKFVVEVTKPENFYGATALKRKVLSNTVEQFSADNYFDLSDSPMMFNKTDTIQIDLGETDVVVSVYSPNGVLKATELREDVSNIMFAQKEYLGGTLPVDRYVIMLYLYEGQSATGASGALEHSYSTVFSMPEMPANVLSQFIKDVTAHEFFHIVTPLNIHSEHIHDYNFIKPQMSKHLWLYEGSTEYAAQHMQATSGMFTLPEFLAAMKSKIRSSKTMYKDNLPFTELSKKALGEHENQYGNVYEKGALIAMCLDILLLEESNGEKNLRWVMKQLSAKYGKDKAFSDEKLFDEITEMTYSSVREFFAKYVEGEEALPLTESFAKVGIEYADKKTVEMANLGVKAVWNPFFRRLSVTEITDEKVAKKNKLKNGYTITKIDGEEITESNYAELFLKRLMDAKKGEKFSLGVMYFENGEPNEETVKIKTRLEKTTIDYFLQVNDDASEEMIKLRKNWLSN